MDHLTDRNYSFVSKALDPDTFTVVDMKGEEGLSKCYRFDITMVSDNAEIDLDSVLRNRATFTIHRNEKDDVVFHGMLAGFEQQQAVGDRVFYHAVLVPRLWRLGLTRHNQVFLDQTVKEMVEAVLKEGGLTSRDFEFKLKGDYIKLGYACQYGETHLEFISRRLAHEGIYFYFDQTDSGEKVILTDTAIAHQARPHGKDLVYSPPSGLMDALDNEVILGLVCRYKTVPRTVRLKDYNYRKPSLEVTAQAVVDEKSSGEVYLYGEHIRSPEQGQHLAKLRAQELFCGKQTFVGESSVPYISPGFTFTLGNHYRNSYNQKYLAVEITHEGSQAGSLTAGLQQGPVGGEKKPFYRNHFTAITANIQFRPPQTAQKPKITGTLNAKIDAAGSGKYAELDEHGRYKVILPFDRSGRKDGKASAWLRMAQPYAGTDHGMHFPLHKGAEVLLTFIEGNPDRPVIAAAVPNPEAPSPVTAADQTMAKITTAGGNKIHIEDKEATQRILMQTPTSNSWIRMGAPNDPPAAGDGEGGSDDGSTQLWKGEPHTDGGAAAATSEGHAFKDGFALSTEGHLQAIIGLNYSVEVGGFAEKIVLGGENVQVIGEESKVVLGGEFAFHAPEKWGFSPSEKKMHALETRITGVNTTVTQQNTRISDQVTRLEATVQELQGAKTELQESHTRIAEQVAGLTVNKTELSEQLERLSGTVTELREECTKISGMETQIAESVTKIQENATAITATRTEISEIDTRLSNESTSLAGSIAQVAGLISQM